MCRWLIGHDGAPSPAMRDYIEAEGLDFGMASPRRYELALADAGFVDIALRSRHEWYEQVARHELDAMRGPLHATGEHRPTHIRARLPPA